MPNGSRHGDNPKLKPTGIQIVGSNHPRTLETYRRQDDVFGYELQFLLSINRVPPVSFENLNYKIQATETEDCMMCCPSNKVIKSDTHKKFSSSRRVTRKHLVWHFTSNGTDECLSGLLSLTHGQRSQQQRGTNHAPISFDQQAQVSQSHTSYRNKEFCYTPRSMAVEVLSSGSRRASQYPVCRYY